MSRFPRQRLSFTAMPSPTGRSTCESAATSPTQRPSGTVTRIRAPGRSGKRAVGFLPPHTASAPGGRNGGIATKTCGPRNSGWW